MATLDSVSQNGIHHDMTVIDIALAAVAGSAGAIAAATLASPWLLARTVTLVAGVAGGIVADALVASTVAAQRPLPLSATAQSGGADVAAMLGSAAAAALGGIVIAIVAAILAGALRRHRQKR
ncbi:MAG: hypothetical protein ABI294_06620 [Casimicrobiaceae bacterium]